MLSKDFMSMFLQFYVPIKEEGPQTEVRFDNCFHSQRMQMCMTAMGLRNHAATTQ